MPASDTSNAESGQFGSAPFAAIDHVQLAIPDGCEEQARRFYGGLLGMKENRLELAG